MSQETRLQCAAGMIVEHLEAVGDSLYGPGKDHSATLRDMIDELGDARDAEVEAVAETARIGDEL